MKLNVLLTEIQTYFSLVQATLDVLSTFEYKLNLNWKISLRRNLKLKKFQSKTVEIDVEQVLSSLQSRAQVG